MRQRGGNLRVSLKFMILRYIHVKNEFLHNVSLIIDIFAGDKDFGAVTRESHLRKIIA